MEEFIQFFKNYSYQWIIALFFTFLSFMAKKFYNIYKNSVKNKKETAEKELNLKKEIAEKESQEQEVIKEGLLALLRFRINRLCTFAEKQQYLTIDQKIDLQDLYTAYELLGGNSRTHERYEQVIKYEIKNINTPVFK